MKSQYVDMLLKVVAGVFKDAQLAYPGDGGFAKDLATLTRLVKDRGIGTFLFDLPNLDDLLLAGLRDSRLTLQGPLSQRVSKKAHVPKFLSGLWLRVFDSTGCLLEDVDVNAILFIRQICLMFKKLELPCSQKRMEDTLNEYRVIDQGLRQPSHDWLSDNLGSPDGFHRVHFCDIMDTDNHSESLPFGGPDERLSDSDRQLLADLQDCADELSAQLGAFNPISASCEGKKRNGSGRGYRHGPGAVAHKSGIVDKYDFPFLSNKLLRTFPRIFMIPKGDQHVTSNHEVPARLIAVPKTAKAPRLIAAEPVEHQWCQQLILNWFNRQFNEKFSEFINLGDQESSKMMAHHGSLTKEYVTVDLSSASDRLSCWTVERIFRCNPSLLTALHAARTRWVENAIPGTTPYFLKLKKYASQGTACTFPVQTFVFMTIAMAALRGSSSTYGKSLNQNMVQAFLQRRNSGPPLSGSERNNLASARGRVRVFGDDIIMPKSGYDRLIRLLHLLQLKVNTSKSFSEGYFRESCGGDYYRGYDVTPVKVKRIDATGPELRASLLDTSNNLFSKGFWHAAEEVGYLLGKRLNFLPIVSSDSGTSGRMSFTGSWYGHLAMRWDPNLQLVQYKSWGLKTRTPMRDRDGRSRMRKFLLENPVRGLMDCNPYDSDLRERGKSSDGIAWRALEKINFFRANRTT